jgi:hypothetical protein
MFSCKKASQLISLRCDRKLNFIEIMSLQGHLMMCKVCRQVSFKYQILQKMLSKFKTFIENENSFKIVLSSEASLKIKKKIKEETANNKFN